MTEAALRTMRGKNSTLMNGNLALLMAIREADAEIEAAHHTLQKQCAQLEKDGVAIPSRLAELLDEEPQGHGNGNATESKMVAAHTAPLDNREDEAMLLTLQSASSSSVSRKMDVNVLVDGNGEESDSSMES
ncbi:hypothetical protein BBJ28_00007640 [Nothophytophthora sp. Chile5]|nr:hypothetical protein BBJ28_00007640 [Nothophytophthora sp. Chile5]